MKRREFLAGLPLLAAAPSLLGMRRRPGQTIRVAGPRLVASLERLSRFGRTAEGGWRRVAFSDADREARGWLLELLREAGLDPRVDAAANIIAVRPGSQTPALPPLMMGSHTDTVPDGGHYDGTVGALAAIEVARTLAEHDVTLRHPLEVAIFSNEEGGKTGSRALAGEVEPRELDLVTASGRTIGDGLRFLGGDPAALDSVVRQPGSVAAYLELHIEQGSVLERAAVPIGVVEGIVGIERWLVEVTGFANHAGTTPMDQRQDALLAAARWIDATHRIVREQPGTQVGTVGRLQVEPNAPNVIAGRVSATLELRDLQHERIAALHQRIAAAAAAIGRETDTAFDFERFYLSRAAPTVEPLRRAIEAAAADLELPTMRLPSGAGHDAQSIAVLGPIGMIFVPSVGGISHSPRELTRPEDIVAGANVLLHALLRADAG
ncbi:MAG: Zn-dependent hydrolase [Longimicrobiales bacterium]